MAPSPRRVRQGRRLPRYPVPRADIDVPQLSLELCPGRAHIALRPSLGTALFTKGRPGDAS
jgi:hypothetical protein